MTLWTEQFVVVNKYSRPAMKLLGVRGLVIHWTATNGATDENEKAFFDGADGGGSRYASAHMFVDRDSAIQVIPFNEVAYHANDHTCKVAKLSATAPYYAGGGANLTSIGIEMCVEKDGTIHLDTVARTVDIAVELCRRYGLNPLTDIFRHYDVTGKNCPAPWVANVALFNDFKNRVNANLHGASPTPSPQPAPQPSANVIGRVRVIVDGLNIRTAPSTSASIARVAKKGEVFDVFANQNDWHNVGGSNWVFGNNGQYLELVRDTPAPQPAPAPAKKKYIVLPASATSWNVYPLTKAPVKANACGQLNPHKFGGLTYEILGNPQPDVYVIQTSNFGMVKIYGASSTGATIVVK